MWSIVASLFNGPLFVAVRYVVFFYPVWLTLLLGFMFFSLWLRYVRAHFIQKQGSVLLEFKLPKEITKSPQAMEIVLTILQQTGAASYLETFIDGKVRPWFSLELVSIDGNVHFYMWAHKKFKSLIEAHVYAQYPNVEVHEVPEDYATAFSYDPERSAVWGTYFRLEKPDAFPIKTYIDYGLDKDPKEEFKIDPLASTLEFLGNVGKGNQLWIQIVFQAHKKLGLKEGKPTFLNFGKKLKAFFSDFGRKKLQDVYHLEGEDWKVAAKKEIQKIRDGLVDPVTEEERRPTKGETETIAAIERSLAKIPFETTIRGFYIADKDAFDAINITGLIGAFRQFNSKELNGFRLGWFTDHEDNAKDIYRYFFKNHGKKVRYRMEKNMLRAYKLRSFFQYPYKFFHAKPFILTTEELATIYHFPGQVVATPTLTRIPSKKAEAPANLPV